MHAGQYQDLIPVSLSDQVVINSKQDLIYLGRESLIYLRNAWEIRAAYYSQRGLASTDIFDRMEFIDESQWCRKHIAILEELAMVAESKPSIFGELPLVSGSRIICFLPETKRYADCLLMRAICDGDYNLVYEIKILSHGNRSARITPSKMTVFPTDSFGYLKHHPNFFRFYLSACAGSEDELKNIEEMVNALPS